MFNMQLKEGVLNHFKNLIGYDGIYPDILYTYRSFLKLEVVNCKDFDNKDDLIKFLMEGKRIKMFETAFGITFGIGLAFILILLIFESLK